jgi:hypothetical protein
MRTFEQLAQSAYQAHTKELQKRIGVSAPEWDKLPATDRECWIAATKQLWAEFSALR